VIGSVSFIRDVVRVVHAEVCVQLELLKFRLSGRHILVDRCLLMLSAMAFEFVYGDALLNKVLEQDNPYFLGSI